MEYIERMTKRLSFQLKAHCISTFGTESLENGKTFTVQN